MQRAAGSGEIDQVEAGERARRGAEFLPGGGDQPRRLRDAVATEGRGPDPRQRFRQPRGRDQEMFVMMARPCGARREAARGVAGGIEPFLGNRAHRVIWPGRARAAGGKQKQAGELRRDGAQILEAGTRRLDIGARGVVRP